MTTDETPPNWLQRTKIAAKKRPWIVALWRVLRSPFLSQEAAQYAGKTVEVRDLEKILNLKLPPNEAFLAARASAHTIGGMFTDFSMALVDSLLSLQTKAGIAGNLLEFGVLKGRSAALIGRHLRADERLVLIDIHDQLDRAAITPFRDAVDFVVCSTEKVEQEQPQYCKPRTYRFVHIDASHAYQATFVELALADKLLAPKGIIVLDDFTNLNYSQNIAAIFKYLYTSGTDLTFFVVTDEKGYLCRKADFDLYGGFILDRLIPEMASRDVSRCVLARTDSDPEYRAFYANDRPSAGQDEQFYGLDIYKNYYRYP